MNGNENIGMTKKDVNFPSPRLCEDSEEAEDSEEI
jgi:hypothetical protein